MSSNNNAIIQLLSVVVTAVAFMVSSDWIELQHSFEQKDQHSKNVAMLTVNLKVGNATSGISMMNDEFNLLFEQQGNVKPSDQINSLIFSPAFK